MEWISVKDSLPPDRDVVLWFHDLKLREKCPNILDSGECVTGYYMEEIESICINCLYTCDFIFAIEEATHWMPLPQPPKGD